MPIARTLTGLAPLLGLAVSARAQGPDRVVRPWLTLGAGAAAHVRECEGCPTNTTVAPTPRTAVGLVLAPSAGLTVSPRTALGGAIRLWSSPFTFEDRARRSGVYYLAVVRHRPRAGSGLVLSGLAGRADFQEGGGGSASRSAKLRTLGAAVGLRDPAAGTRTLELTLEYLHSFRGALRGYPGRYEARLLAARVAFSAVGPP